MPNPVDKEYLAAWLQEIQDGLAEAKLVTYGTGRVTLMSREAEFRQVKARGAEV